LFGAVRVRIWEDLSTGDYQQITLMCNVTKAVDQRESDPPGLSRPVDRDSTSALSCQPTRLP
jgi:hypothetical protein